MRISALTDSDADPVLELPHGGSIRMRRLLGSTHYQYVAENGSQAFLVEQAADAVLRPHFHFTAQFQLVVAGGGQLGRRPVQPCDIHYADPGTPYGPVTPGP